MRFITLSLLILLVIVSPNHSVSAMDSRQRQEFERILNLSLGDLTRESADLLERRYPEEDWKRWDFPPFVFTNKSSEIGYKIAVKEPGLLGDPGIALKGSDLSIPCYCFCDSMGHQSLLHCFWKEGRTGGEFDEHASSCTICYGQAMLAFLWDAIGADREEILAGMERKFEWLVEKHHR